MQKYSTLIRGLAHHAIAANDGKNQEKVYESLKEIIEFTRAMDRNEEQICAHARMKCIHDDADCTGIKGACSEWKEDDIICPYCNGFGSIPEGSTQKAFHRVTGTPEQSQCELCRGTGKIKNE